MLPTIAIIIGAVAILARLPVVIWPEKGRDFWGRIVTVRPFISLLGLALVALGVLIGYAALRETLALEFVLWIIGGLAFVFGVIYIAAPQTAGQMWESLVVPRSRGVLRVMFGSGVIIGLFLVVLGLTWMAQNHEMQADMPQRTALREGNSPQALEALSKQVSALEATVARNSEAAEQVALINKQLPDMRKAIEESSEEIAKIRESLVRLEDDFNKLRAEIKSAPEPNVNEP